MRYALAFALAIATVGCATTMSGTASQLQPVSEAEKEECEFLGLITKGAGGRGAVGRNASSAVAKALNEAAARGADSYSLVSTDSTSVGSSVVVEAYRCGN